MLRTAEWDGWSSRKSRFLWLYGIPGAGKTVLASYLIKHLKSQYGHGSRVAVAYYYCYFGHNQDETMPFLSWILSQLSRKIEKIPSALIKIWKEGCRPNEHELCEALQDVLADLDVAYVVIDAVDESLNREHLVKSLMRLAQVDGFRKIQLFATSRQYLDIEDAFRTRAASVSMSNTEVDKDIRTYIHSQLEMRPCRTGSWPPDLVKEVEAILARKAGGM